MPSSFNLPKLIGIPGAIRDRVEQLIAEVCADGSDRDDSVCGSTTASVLCWLDPQMRGRLLDLAPEGEPPLAVTVLVDEQAASLVASEHWPEHWQWAPWPLSSQRLQMYLRLADRAARAHATHHARSGRAWSSIGQQLLEAIRAAGMFEFEYDLASGERRSNIRQQFGDAAAPRSFDDLMAFLHQEDRPAVAAAFDHCRETGSEFRTRARVRVGQGDYRWTRSIGRVIERSEHHPGRLVGITWDSHREEIAKQAEKLAQEQLAEVLSLGGMYSWEWRSGNPQRLIAFNQLESVESPPLQHRLDDLIASKDREADALRFQVAVERGERYSSEVHLRLPGGSPRRMLLCGVPRKNGRDELQSMMGVALDLTDQHAMQSELSEARALLLESLAAGQMYCWEWEVGAGNSRILGPCRDILGVNPADPPLLRTLIHPDDEFENQRLVDQALERGSYRNEFRIIRPDGEMRWISSSANLVTDHMAQSQRLIGSSIDVTERRASLLDLRVTQERLSVAMDAARLNPWAVDLQTGKVQPGPRDLEIFGEEIRSRQHFEALVLAEDRVLVEQLGDPDFLASGQPLHAEFRIRRKDGEQRWVSCYAKAMLDDRGDPVSLVGVSQDISESRDAQEQLAQTLIQLDRVQTATNVMLWEWRRSAGVVCYAAGGARLSGAAVPRLDPRDWWRFTRLLIACSRSDAQVIDEEARVLDEQGRSLWVSLQGRRTEFAADGSAIVSGVMIDISARKQDRERVAAAERRLHQALEAANMRCWDWHAESARRRGRCRHIPPALIVSPTPVPAKCIRKTSSAINRRSRQRSATRRAATAVNSG